MKYLKKVIKEWLGITKIESEIRNMNYDIISLMDKDLDRILETKLNNLKGKPNAKKIRSSSKSR